MIYPITNFYVNFPYEPKNYLHVIDFMHEILRLALTQCRDAIRSTLHVRPSLSIQAAAPNDLLSKKQSRLV